MNTRSTNLMRLVALSSSAVIAFTCAAGASTEAAEPAPGSAGRATGGDSSATRKRVVSDAEGRPRALRRVDRVLSGLLHFPAGSSRHVRVRLRQLQGDLLHE